MSVNIIYLFYEFEGDKCWIEYVEKGHAIRQIIKTSKGNVHISCFEDCLAEGQINIDDFDCIVKKINSNEFESLWKKYTGKYVKKWNELKHKVQFNKTINAKVLYRYPQGWILLTHKGLAVCEDNLDLLINQTVEGKICGFDEKNMWLILDIINY